MNLRCIEDRGCGNGEWANADIQGNVLADQSPPEEQCTAVLLSKRQQEILLAACLGTPDKVIADNLGVSPRTLEGHWRAIHRKLGSLNRCQAGFLFAAARENVGGEKSQKRFKRSFSQGSHI
jgi:DNA-binding NarL/FixJ family response regulator